MGANGYQGQIRAIDQPGHTFTAGTELMSLIRNAAKAPVLSVTRIGIYSSPPSKVELNGQVFEIGKTYMYQARNTQITSIKFVENSPKQAIIDFIVRTE